MPSLPEPIYGRTQTTLLKLLTVEDANRIYTRGRHQPISSSHTRSPEGVITSLSNAAPSPAGLLCDRDFCTNCSRVHNSDSTYDDRVIVNADLLCTHAPTSVIYDLFYRRLAVTTFSTEANLSLLVAMDAVN